MINKLNRYGLIILILVFIFTGCSKGPTNPVHKKTTIVTTLFPLYDFTRTLIGNNAEIVLLLPPGVESHGYEPTPQDIVKINNADVFIYTGEIMEPWAHKIIEKLDNEELIIVDTSKNIPLTTHTDEQNGDPDDQHQDGKDPHIWLDPVFAQTMTDSIAEGLVKSMPDMENTIDEHALAFKQELETYHQKCLTAFSKTQYKTIVYGGHFAFGYFAQRYGLEHVSPYEGFSPDAEPSPGKIVELIETLKTSGQNTLFFEELIDPRVAKTISKETGAKMLLLHGTHNISKEDFEKGVTYLQLMETNLKNLKEGLGYHE